MHSNTFIVCTATVNHNRDCFHSLTELPASLHFHHQFVCPPQTSPVSIHCHQPLLLQSVQTVALHLDQGSCIHAKCKIGNIVSNTSYAYYLVQY